MSLATLWTLRPLAACCAVLAVRFSACCLNEWPMEIGALGSSTHSPRSDARRLKCWTWMPRCRSRYRTLHVFRTMIIMEASFARPWTVVGLSPVRAERRNQRCVSADVFLSFPFWTTVSTLTAGRLYGCYVSQNVSFAWMGIHWPQSGVCVSRYSVENDIRWRLGYRIDPRHGAEPMSALRFLRYQWNITLYVSSLGGKRSRILQQPGKAAI